MGKIIETVLGWLPWLLKRLVGIHILEQKIARLEEFNAKDRIDKVENTIGFLTYTLNDLNTKTSKLEDRVSAVELMSKVLEHRLDDVADDLTQVRDRVLASEITDEKERMRLRFQLEKMVTDLDRMLETIREVKQNTAAAKSGDVASQQLLEALKKMSNGIGGKRRTINSLLNKLVGRPEDANPPPVAA